MKKFLLIELALCVSSSLPQVWLKEERMMKDLMGF